MRPEDILERYSRQTVLREIGLDGQKKLLEKSVAIIGCGGLGTTSANILVRVGVGRIKLIDRDFVELNNLHRQVLYDESDALNRMPKAEAAAEKLRKVNSMAKIEAVVEDVNRRTIEKIIGDVDLIVDGTDNFETRFLLNDAALKLNKPWILGSAIGTYGMTMNIVPSETPCLRCLISNPPPPGSLPTCEVVGVLTPIPSIIASIQVTEALKILMGKDYSRNLLIFDAWTRDFNLVEVKKKKECPACVLGKYEFLEGREQRAVVLCGRNSVQITPPIEVKLNLNSLAEKLGRIGEVKHTKLMLHLTIPPYELAIFPSGRAIIKGTTDEKIARSLYSKYVGL